MGLRMPALAFLPKYFQDNLTYGGLLFLQTHVAKTNACFGQKSDTSAYSLLGILNCRYIQRT